MLQASTLTEVEEWPLVMQAWIYPETPPLPPMACEAAATWEGRAAWRDEVCSLPCYKPGW